MRPENERKEMDLLFVPKIQITNGHLPRSQWVVPYCHDGSLVMSYPLYVECRLLCELGITTDNAQ